jgi:hypothetical protein
MLIPLAFIVHVGAAAADAQESARQLLLGVTSHAPTLSTPEVSNAPNAQRSAKVTRVTGDAQESARQLLLGATSHTPPLPSPEVSRVNRNRIHGDAQVYAQHLLLGRRDTPGADF